MEMIGPRKRNVQKGRGIGSILSSIFSKIAPIARTILNIGRNAIKTKPVQSVIQSAKNEALKTGIQIADDAIQGKNIGESIKSNTQAAAKSIASSALGEAKKYVDKKPTPKKRPVSKKKSKPPKRRKRDIFS